MDAEPTSLAVAGLLGSASFAVLAASSLVLLGARRSTASRDGGVGRSSPAGVPLVGLDGERHRVVLGAPPIDPLLATLHARNEIRASSGGGETQGDGSPQWVQRLEHRAPASRHPALTLAELDEFDDSRRVGLG